MGKNRLRNPRLWSLSHVSGHEMDAYNRLHQAWDEIRAFKEDVAVGEAVHGVEVFEDLRVQVARIETALGLVNFHLARLRTQLADLNKQGNLPS